MLDLRYLIGTNTSGKDKEYLQIGHIEVPNEDAKKEKLFNYDTLEIGGPGQARRPFKNEITQKINHEGEVNKARYMPQKPDIIATLGIGGNCYIFDRTKHPNTPKDDEIHAEMRLTGHTDEGFGLAWNPRQEGILATTSQDSTVRIWNIKDGFSHANSQEYPAESVITTHTDIVNDVQFHPKNRPLFATCSDDRTYQIHDLRKPDPLVITKAHSDAVNCLTWHDHPKFEYILLTGSADGKVAAWDVRNANKKLHSFEGHEDSVVKIQWTSCDHNKFATASYDRQIIWWDTVNIGKEQSPEDAEDGPPELYVKCPCLHLFQTLMSHRIFRHGGFVDRITDFDFHPQEVNLTIAAAEDNQMMCFQPAHELIFPWFNNTEQLKTIMSEVEE
jgi:histone-binding protein RBBP4